MSWVHNYYKGYKYKIWMNGQGKSKVRSWHLSHKIDPVEIDDFFDIWDNRGHAQMMYPGDLNGGAENVANCRCWVRYTNNRPSNLKKKGTIQINPNVSMENENKETFNPNNESTTKSKEKETNKSTSSNENEGLFTKIRDKLSTTKKRMMSIFSKKEESFHRDKTTSNNSKWKNIKKSDLPEELPDKVFR